MDPVIVKPGWTTTEFWMTLGVQAISLFVLFGLVDKGEEAQVRNTLAEAIQNVAAMVASLGSIWKYIQGRAEVKAAANAAVTSENNLKMAVLGGNAARVLAGLLICLFLIPPQAIIYAQEKAVVPAAEVAKPAAKAAAKERGNHSLNLRDRRAMGLTVGNLLALAKELRAEGAIDDDSTAAEEAAALAMKLREKTPHAFANANAMDWESIISFIEKLMPIIKMLMSFFNQPAPAPMP